MKITIIRHAEPDYENNTLTEKGFREADILGRYLQGEKIDYLYSSPLPRAKFTADAIVKYNRTKSYKILEFLREFEPFMWDRTPTFLASDTMLYDKDKWTENEFMKNLNVISRYEFVKSEFSKFLEEHGYKKNGVYYEAVKPNHEHIVLACHFGLESFLLSEMLNVPVIALINHTCASPTGMTTVYTEEREKGKAIFRLNTFGSLEHLIYAGEEPSFMARFDEVYGDGKDNIT